VFDKPVETAVEWTFHKAFETFGGPNAVGHRPETGREQALQMESQTRASKEKEL
jgi:fission process protein 1